MKKEIWSDIVLYVGIFVLGVCLTLWADKVTNLASIALGCIALLYAATLFTNYFKDKDKSTSDNLQLIYAIVMLVLGGILIFRVGFLKELISFIVGIYILISSVIRLNETIKVGKSTNTKLTGATVLACIGIFIGIMCIVGKYLLPDLIITYIGILLIIYSVISISNLVMIRRK